MTLPQSQSDLLRRFETHLAAARRSRWQKTIRGPRRILGSKILEVALGISGRTLPVEAEAFWGGTMRLRAPETVSMTIHRYGFFDEAMTRIFLEFLGRGMTVFDVGAHFGYFTVLAAHIVGQAGRVHAFEPTPGTFAVLAENTAHRANVALNHCAVDSARGSVVINDLGLRYSAFNSLFDPRLPGSARSRLECARVPVEAVVLDDYAEAFGSPDFVKIDAEGSEQRVLSGMTRMIERRRPMIALEVGDWGIEGTRPCRDVVQFLLDRGYRALECRDGRIVPHELKDAYEDGNLVFLPA